MKVVSHSQSSKLKETKKNLKSNTRRIYDPQPLARNTSRKSVKPVLEKKPIKRVNSIVFNKKPIIPVRYTKKSLAAQKQISESKSVKSTKSAKKRSVKPLDIIKKAEKDERSSNQSHYNDISFHSGAIFSMKPLVKTRKPAVNPSINHQNSRMSLSSNGRKSKRE